MPRRLTHVKHFMVNGRPGLYRRRGKSPFAEALVCGTQIIHHQIEQGIPGLDLILAHQYQMRAAA